MTKLKKKETQMSTFYAIYIVEYYAAPWNNGEDFEFINNGKIFMILAVS